MKKTIFYRFASLTLVVITAFSLLTGCTPAKDTASSDLSTKVSKDSTVDASYEETKEIGLPIVNEPITLTYWCPLDSKYSATIKSMNELPMSEELEKRTGIHIEFKHPVAGQEEQQLNLMMASDTMPDIIETNWTSKSGGPSKAIADGIIIDMTDLIDQYAPNYKALLSQYPNALKEVTTSDNKQYMMTSFTTDDAIKIMVGPQIRTDWLNKLGLEPPKTLEDWYRVLTAFKEQDPNGNGKADEIPFTSAGYKTNESLTSNLNIFAWAYGISTDFYMIDNTVKYGPLEPEFKEFLTLMNQWYQEGLIDPDFITTDKKMFDSKVTTGIAGSWSAGLMGDMGKYLQYFEAEKPDWSIGATTFPMLEENGTRYNFNTNMNSIAGMAGCSITSTNKYAVETTKWFDYAYSEEGHLLYNFGIEGLTYELVNGEPQFTDLITNNENKWDVTTALGHYCRGVVSNGAHMPDIRVFDLRAGRPEQMAAKKEIWKDATYERVLPPVKPSEENSQRAADIMTDIYTYVNESVSKFIIGTDSIDGNYDKFITNLKNMGIEEAIGLKQTALDEFNAK